MELVSQNASFQWLRAISDFPITRQLGFLIGLSASIALGLSVVFWSQSEDYVPLYMDLDMQSASEVIDVLERNNTPFRVDKRSGAIQVPSDQLQRLRMQLASEGLPSDKGNGFDMLADEPQLGISGFMEKARYDHALEQELAETISTIANVKTARVHLAVPKASGFIRKTGRPAASVLVNLYNGRDLSNRQLAGITHLVAASVPELLTKDVSVIDQQGRLLSDSDSDMGLGAGIEQLEMTRAVEQSYVDRILELLIPIAGPAGVKAQVNADLDFNTFESTSEIYSPEKSIRSEQVEQERNESNKPNGGVPGTLSNQPPDNPDIRQNPGQAPATRTAQTSSNSKTVRNYEMDKTISHKRQAPGALTRLTVAVVLDHKKTFNAEGEAVKQPYAQAEIDQITDLIREAVGFDTARGDRVTVTNSEFAVAEPIEIVEPSILEAPWIWEIARTSVALIICVILVFFVIRPVMRSTVNQGTKTTQALALSGGGDQDSAARHPVQQAQQIQKSDVPQSDRSHLEKSESENTQKNTPDTLALNSPEPSILTHQQQTPLYRHQLDAARDLVEQQPETVAHVVKHWVASDEED